MQGEPQVLAIQDSNMATDTSTPEDIEVHKGYKWIPNTQRPCDAAMAVPTALEHAIRDYEESKIGDRLRSADASVPQRVALGGSRWGTSGARSQVGPCQEG